MMQLEFSQNKYAIVRKENTDLCYWFESKKIKNKIRQTEW